MESEKTFRTLQELYNNHHGGIVMCQNVNGGMEHFFDGFNSAEEAKAEILSIYDDKPALKSFMENFLNSGTWEHV